MINSAKTKILATLGPAVNNEEKIKELVKAGISGVRFNFSHSDYEIFKQMHAAVEKVSADTKKSISILLDLGGPKIRTGEMSEPEILIKTGETIEITTEDVVGTKDLISTSYKSLPQDSNIGDKIMIDDGLLHLRIIEKKEKSVVCKIETGGLLKRRKGMNLPGMKLSTPSVTKKDFSDLEFALNYRIDYIALSFVREANDIIDLRKWLENKGHGDISIIAKIEKDEAVRNFEKILYHSDGIMVARGDLGVEMHPQDVPIIQKNIIRRCNELGKPVITATQMLDSMIHNPMPTRAEASDVANAVLDGTDVVMLSGETSVGAHPALTVQTMENILIRTESNFHLKKKIKFDIPTKFDVNILDAFARSISRIAEQTEAASILCFTRTGTTAQMISKFRPGCPVFAVTNRKETFNKLALRWGVIPLFFEQMIDVDTTIIDVLELMKSMNAVSKNDLVIVTSGQPYSDELRENNLRFELVK